MSKNNVGRTGEKESASVPEIRPPLTAPKSDAAPKKKKINWGFADKAVYDWLVLIGQVFIPFVILVLGWITTQLNRSKNNVGRTEEKESASVPEIRLPPTALKSDAAPKKKKINWGFTDKAVYDWLILIGQVFIPFVILVLGWIVAQQLNQQLEQASQRQHTTDLQIAADQQQEVVLKTCLDDIRDLLLNKDLQGSQPEDEVAIVARVEVLTALRRLNGERKGLLVQFLSEAGLVNGKPDVIISLQSADLNHANLSNVNLNDANLNDANLNDANLSGANLSGAYLNSANLSGANLSYAGLSGAELTSANLIHADLSYAGLSSAELTSANLIHADLTYTNLKSADLGMADLSYAKLNQAYLSQASFYKAIITKRQLLKARSLEGTIFPDGSKHP